MTKLIFFLFIFLVFTFQVFAQLEGNPENWCRNGAFPHDSDDYKLAKIKGKKGERIYFYGDENDCPNEKNCRRKSYLIPNDEVIVSRTFGNWACGWFQPRKGSETVGWITVDKLEFVNSNEKPETKDWIGEWNYYDNSINIKPAKKAGFFDIKGNAFWKGLGDNIHIGELDSTSKPDGNVLKIGEDDKGEYACKVTMRLLGRYLIASDNLNCGGANVTFSGVYLKK